MKNMKNCKLIACRTMEDELLSLIPPELDYEFLDYALHDTPEILKEKLAAVFAADEDHATILMGYGLCSNSVLGVSSPRHRLVIPRVHDCISLFLGSRQRYDEEFAKAPATFYLSKGWIKQEGDPYSEHLKNCRLYGEELAWEFTNMLYANYERVAYIHTLPPDEKEMKYSKKVADFLKVKFTELDGKMDFFRALVTGEWDERFIIVEPGKCFEQKQFM
ncbi:MAG: DUF1638 domain-containing protein [Bacillota bacterium]|nr:DUF1638 domain-containing protein [Bacillota bacterium]